jgi:hypothetical protein
MTFEGTYQDNKRPVVTSSPDCLVYLNGRKSLPSGSDPHKRVDIQPLIESVQVSLSVSNPPGTAQLSMHVPKHYEKDLFRAGNPTITTMMEVQIYAKGHFTVGGAPRYYPIFWGVTQSVNHAWSGGQRKVDISCEDILYWWNMQRINVNPSIQGASTAQIGRFNVQGSGHFTRKNPFSIMYSLARTSYGDSMNANVYPAQRQHRPEMTDDDLQEMMSYWSQKWGRMRHSLRMFGPNGRVIQGSDLADLLDNRPNMLKEGKKSEGQRDKDATYKVYNQTENGIDLSKISPFQQVISKMGNVEVWSSDFQTKMDIANTVTEAMGYEFFMDVTGELVFKPPFYNLDVIPNKPVSWIRPVDVIDESYNENPPEATMIEASGSLKRNMDVGGGDLAKPRATYIDYRLVQKYGWKPTNFSSTFYGSGIEGESPMNLFFHLIDRLDRENVRIHNGDITIPMRPEMRLGYPVYVKHKDCFYYVETINHSFNYGGQCTTSLSVIGRRKKFYAPFDSWATATSNENKKTGSQPDPGDRAEPNMAPVNIYNRPVEDRTGNPEPDKNVNLVYVEKSEEEREEEKKQGQHPSTFEEDEKKADKVQRNLVSMRTQFAVQTPATYKYEVDEDKNKDVERNDRGEKVQGPLTAVNIEEVEMEDGTKVPSAELPVSDERGYEVIGGYEYGRSASITRDGIQYNANDTYSDVQRLLHMEPEDVQSTDTTHTGTNVEADPTKDQNLRINPNNYGRRLEEIIPQGSDSPSPIANSRGFAANTDEEPFQENEDNQQSNPIQTPTTTASPSPDSSITGDDGQPIQVSTGRSFSRNRSVSRWENELQQARNELGLSEEKYPDHLLLSILHIESNGQPDARRTNDDGELSKFCGPFQIGPANAAETGNQNTDFLGEDNSDGQAVVDSAKHFMAVQERYADTHQYNEEMMALTWKAGSGTASTVRDKMENGASGEEIVRYMDSKFTGEDRNSGGYTDEYIGKYRKAKSVWYDGEESESEDQEQEVMTFSEEEVYRGPKDKEQKVDDETPEKSRQEEGEDFSRPEADQSTSIFTKEFQDNLSENPDALPSDVNPPRDPSIMPVINDYLKNLYEEAFESESDAMTRVRTGTMKFDEEDVEDEVLEFEEDEVDMTFGEDEETMVFDEEDVENDQEDVMTFTEDEVDDSN